MISREEARWIVAYLDAGHLAKLAYRAVAARSKGAA